MMLKPHTLAAKLTISHVLSTLAVILTIVAVFQILFYVMTVIELRSELEDITITLQNYSGADYEASIDEITDAFRFLEQVRDEDNRTVFMLTDAEGLLIESTQHPTYTPQTSLYSYLDANDKLVIDEALAGKASYSLISVIRFNIFGDVFSAVPILDENGLVKAATVVSLSITPWFYVWDTIETLAYVLGIFLIFALPLIIFLSRRQAKRLASRIEHVGAVAKNWAQGDLSRYIEDKQRDEIAELSTDLNVMAQELQQLLETKQELAVIKERNRLAIELHDSVKQQVFAIGLKIATVQAKIEDADSKKHLDQMQTMVQNVKQELNRLIFELKPSELEQQDFLSALKEYVSRWSESHGIAVDVLCKGDKEMQPELEQSFFRITQEALANILKHSQASQVDIEVDLEDDYRLRIEDNGKGFNQDKLESNGIGLQVMKERIEKLGGQFKLTSFPSKGTSVEVMCSSENINSIFKIDINARGAGV